ncbi:hypothetical protein CK505_07945 [Kocuria sp. WN036]|uniref:hypothetical protein n=1 Tax=Kocuria sp. WN036 TaxID=2032628 RepID=UPI000BABFF20|nr:hypothetical protein [Kocuria sp. WN036]PAU91085.1 hypothetical protein CK505_07945 [Kocuria sp. WN036]
MDPELDPQVRHAVERPAETARGPEDAQLRVRLAGEPARRALGTHWEQGLPEDAAPSDDRLAAAVLLATLFGDTFWLERAARLPSDVPGCPSAPPSGLLELTRVPGARAALAAVLERPLLTGLLEWGTNPLPEQPPLAVARAARDLGIPDDGRVYKVVRRRAERFLAREHDGSEPLEQFVTLLNEAERGHREDGPVLSGETLPPAAPPAPGPTAGSSSAAGPAADGGIRPATPPPGAPPAGSPENPQWGVSPASPAPPPPGPLPGQYPGPGAPGPGGPGYGTPGYGPGDQRPGAPGASTHGASGPVFGPGPGGWPPRPAEPVEDDSDNLKAWGFVFLGILAVIAALIFIL